MARITESKIEKFSIEFLEHQEYQYIYTPSIIRTLIKFLSPGDKEERVVQ